jgi:hypothetical protein
MGLNNIEVRALTTSGANVFSGTNGSGVYTSGDNGSTWATANTGLKYSVVYSLAIGGGTTVFAGTDSGGVWSRPLSQLLSVQEIQANKDMSIYPNPADGKFTMSFSNAIGNASIQIFNTLGESIYNEQFSNATLNKKDIELKVPAGIYFIQVRDGEKQYTGKIIVE